MDETSSSAMEITGEIIRRSIHTFLKYFDYFSTTPVMLLLPFSVSALLSSEALFQPYFSFSFHFLGSSAASGFISVLSVNFFVIPFAVSSFLIAKASVIEALNHHKPSVPPPFFSVVSNYGPLILTYLCNLVLIFAINTIIFTLFFFHLNYLKAFGLFLLPGARIFFYSFLGNTVFISNFALIVAGMEHSRKGYAAIFKACALRKGKISMALLLSLSTNLGLAAIEALFRYRVLRTYNFLGGFTTSVVLEGILIAYLYSLIVVLDTIACCLFYKNCCESSDSENESAQRCDVV
ncbi:putative Transmembrane protein [Melia azedarach]|uniref:Transmembrane protein n=1 Tax=Melia azedarach TaxID=155640 RepID=A0ACC1X7H0_MELAZ|nr:putative Transmembrane protein [Melia azedarach]